MKRIKANYSEKSEATIAGETGFMIVPVIDLENNHNESCIVDISLAFRTLQGDRGHPNAKEAKDCFLVLDKNNENVLRIFGEERKNNDITLRLFDLLKDHEIKTLLLLSKERKSIDLFFDGKRFKHSFLLDVTVTCTFEDKHVEKFEMNISII